MRQHQLGSLLLACAVAAVMQGFPAMATSGFAESASDVKLEPLDARGAKYKASGSSLANATVMLCPADATSCEKGIRVEPGDKAQDSLTFTVPSSVPAGRYQIELDGKPSGTITVAPVAIQATSLTPSPANVQRGATVTISGSGLAAADIVVDLCSLDVVKPEGANAGPVEPKRLPAIVLERAAAALKFSVTPETPLGRYRVQVRPASSPIPPGCGAPQNPVRDAPGVAAYPGDIAVVPPPVDLISVVPSVPFPTADDRSRTPTFTLTAMGTGFSVGEHSRENVLLFEDMSALKECVPLKPGEKRPEHSCTEGFAAQGRLGGREVVFSGVPYDYRGIRKVRVQVGDVIAPVDPKLAKLVTFSPYSKTVPLVGAFVMTVLLALAVYGLMSTSKQRRAMPFSQRIASWFLEEETNSYSLSKFQFYAWTLAGVLGYLYLTAARSLVQGSLELSAPPEGLATLLATAAGTTVLASGITTAKGSKGSGDFEPSFADFFMHGGVVAPERFQFFIWTAIGVLSFLAITLLHSPADIQDLPRIPTEFLTLTGISAAGYLGGKLARPSPPTISSIAPDPKETPTRLLVTGSMLPTTGTFTIRDLEEDKVFGPDPLPLTAKAPTPKDTNATRPLVKIETPEETARDRAKVLSIEVAELANVSKPQKWPDKKRYRLRIVDADGHSAEGDF